MSTGTPLSEYLKHHNDKANIEKRLISGKLVAYGVPFDPHNDHNEESMTHYIKDGVRHEFLAEPEIEIIPQLVWQTGTINWDDCSVKIEQDSNNSSHFHLKWWNNITISTSSEKQSDENKAPLPQSKSRQSLHIPLYEKAFLTLCQENHEIPTARQVWNYIKNAVDNYKGNYSEVIQEVTSDKIFLASFDGDKDREPYGYRSFEGQISKIRQKYKKTHN